MKQYRTNKMNKTSIKVNDSYKGESIEKKIVRMLNNKETIVGASPLMYTERKDGVLPGCDIRSDKMEYAVELTDKTHKKKIAGRGTLGATAKENMEKEGKEAGSEGEKK